MAASTQAQYAISLGSAPFGSPTFAQSAVGLWFDSTFTASIPAGEPRPVSTEYPMPVQVVGSAAPASATVVYTAPAVSSITTGGTAVVALAAGSIKTGFDLKNPAAATEPLFFSLIGAAGTSETGGTFALAPGAIYQGRSGTNQSLSVNALTAGHTFSAQSY